MNEIDWVQFHKQTKAMEEYLRFQRELETNHKEGWLAKLIKYLSNLTIFGGPGKSKARLRAWEHRVECPTPADLSEELYIKWLEIASEEELTEFYVDPKTHLALRQYEKHSKLVAQVATPEELEAYNKLGQNFRVSTAYAKSLIEPEPEPEKDLDEEFEKEVHDYFQKALEWKVQEVMDDYEDELEEKLLVDVLKHFDDGYENYKRRRDIS